MFNGKITYIFVIFQAVFLENKVVPQENLLYSKLINCGDLEKNPTPYKNNDSAGLGNARLKFRCQFKYATANSSLPRYNGRYQARFTDQSLDNLDKQSQMEAPSAKHSVFNLLTGDDDEEDDDDDLDTEDNEDYKNIVQDNDEDTDEDDDINFFSDEEDTTGPEKLKDEEDGLFKQLHRHSLRMHNFVFPLLFAYKLKFFTVIPLLLGSLVLLVGATGIAGFFFALFSAALGLHGKSPV